MFTGLVEQVGTIAALQGNDDGARIAVRCATPWPSLPSIGASICCSGMCLTAVAVTPDGFEADISHASLAVTTANAWAVGTGLNLETSLTLAKPLGGHLVTGHVDGVGRVASIDPDGDNWQMQFVAPQVEGERLARLIARKGSITVDGVSLTVNAVEGDAFAVNVIPHTRAATTLGQRAVGDAVNLEVDLMARYAARLLDTQEDVAA